MTGRLADWMTGRLAKPRDPGCHDGRDNGDKKRGKQAVGAGPVDAKQQVEVRERAEHTADHCQESAGAAEKRRRRRASPPGSGTRGEVDRPRGADTGNDVTDRTGHSFFYHRKRWAGLHKLPKFARWGESQPIH
jgi:hypothetical protein